MDTGDEFSSIGSGPEGDTALKEASGPCSSTSNESTPNGNGMESLPLSVVQTIDDKATAPPTVEVRHGKQGINVRLTPQVNTALYALIGLGIHRPTLNVLLDMMNLGKTKFKKKWDQSHCVRCNCEIPQGRAGRDCKPCRGIQYSDGELNDAKIMKAFVHHIGYAKTIATDARKRIKDGMSVQDIATLYNVPLQHLDFILKEIPDEPETTPPGEGTGNPEACEAGCVGPDVERSGSNDTDRRSDFPVDVPSVQSSDGLDSCGSNGT